MEKEIIIPVPDSCKLSLKQREQRENYIAEKAMVVNDIQKEKAEKEKMWAWIAEVLKEQSTYKAALDKVNSTF
jgi:hypothetical protein